MSPSRLAVPSLLALAVVALPGRGAQPAVAVTPVAGGKDRGPTPTTLDQVQVIGQATTYSKLSVSPEALDRITPLTSVNDALNELPGVSVSEVDAFGSAVWGTKIRMRGFTSGGNASEQQIGTTIDGVPNGGSGYSGGALANRFIDPLDLETVEVSQGTADIASPSNEALGGTLNFLTSAPRDERRTRVVLGAGDYDARKYYARHDTGLLGGHTRAWVSAASAHNDDWIDGSGHTSRDHLAGKFVSGLGGWTLGGYLSYDNADESEYTSVTPAQFARDRDHDQLTGTLTGIPWLDQNDRSGSRALRENTLGYLRAGFDGDHGFKATLTGYGHHLHGRGDWLPPYLVDVTDDGAGRPESENTSGPTVYGGADLGKIYFVNPDGSAAQALPGCTPRSPFSKDDDGAKYDPDCYPAGVRGVQSYRHTHYTNDRYGITADSQWQHAFGALDNTVRAGLWLEKYRQIQRRDWHRLLAVGRNIDFDPTPYWVQYEDLYDTHEQRYYLEEVARLGAFTGRLGAKQFFVDQTLDRRIGGSKHVRSDDHSDPLLSVGLTWTTPLRGVEAFTGFSQNFAAIPSGVLDDSESAPALARVKPETADNSELGLRVSRWPLTAALTLYQIKFDNRIVSLPSKLVDGIDYLEESDNIYENFGGVDSKGLEAALGYGWDNGWRINAAYTYDRSKYLGSGDAARDAALQIVPGAQVVDQPRQTLVLAADWQGRIWNFGVSGRTVGKRYLDAANRAQLPSTTVFNANAGMHLESLSSRLQGMAASLVVNNLFDKHYLNGVDGEDSAFIGAPRTLVLALTFDL